jgi:hypothetical protein
MVASALDMTDLSNAACSCLCAVTSSTSFSLLSLSTLATRSVASRSSCCNFVIASWVRAVRSVKSAT